MDNLKSFFTGWGSGQELASQDNARYTTLNSQALANTGTMNRQMLDHVNDLQSMVMTGRDKFGNPLPVRQKEEMTAFVAQMQKPYSQGVFSPAPWSSIPEKPTFAMPERAAPTPAIAPPPTMPPFAPADLGKAFSPLPAMPPPPPVVNPGLSSQLQSPVTAPQMQPLQQAQLSTPPPAPQMPAKKKAKKKVTVKQMPRQGNIQGNALTPELTLLPTMRR